MSYWYLYALRKKKIMARKSGKRGAEANQSPEANGNGAFEAKLWANRNYLHHALIGRLPPHRVQRAFERLLAPVWARTEANNAEIATLTDLRDTPLPNLISGELRVKATEKIVETVA
jgi:hypothetical protein